MFLLSQKIIYVLGKSWNKQEYKTINLVQWKAFKQGLKMYLKIEAASI